MVQDDEEGQGNAALSGLAIDVRGLVKSYSGVQVVAGLSLTAARSACSAWIRVVTGHG